MIIEVHNGCDARGGFTRPVLFRGGGYADFDPWKGGSIYCPKCGSYWDYDNVQHLEDTNTDPDMSKDLTDYPCEKGTEGKVGTVVVNDKYEAFCPICGKGKLK